MPKNRKEDFIKKQVQEGAELSMAFKSEAGEIILNHLVKTLEDNLLVVLNGRETHSDADILKIVSECHGVVSALNGMGNKVRYMTGYVARRNADQSLGRG